MSMKRGAFPTQDEHENGRGGLSMRRPDADAYAQCRGAEPGSDSGVSPIQQRDRVHREGTPGGVRLDGTSSGSAGVCWSRPQAARADSSLYPENDRLERVAGDAPGEELSG